MEVCLDKLVDKTHLSRVAFFTAVCWVAITVILLAVLIPNEAKEEDQFKCYNVPKEAKLRDECYDDYNRRYNKFAFPLYCYILLETTLVMIVYVIYSFYASRRIEKLKSDAPRRGPSKCKLFTVYMIQVFMRGNSLEVIFLVLWRFMFPSLTFPEQFSCLPSISKGNTSNVTSISELGDSRSYICKNPQAAMKTRCGIAYIVINAILVVVSLFEIAYLICKACQKRTDFTEDRKFWESYLNGTTEDDYRMPLPVAQNGSTEEVHPEMSRRVIDNHDGEETPPKVQSFATDMRNQVLEDTKYMRVLMPGGIEENHMETDSIFVNLNIQDYVGMKEINDKDRDAILKSYSTQGETSNIISSTEIFTPNEDTEDPCTILAVGRPGIGKTTLATKILRDWAKGTLITAISEAAKCFEFVFLLQFRWLNFDSSISLKQLLSRSPYSINLNNEVFHYILQTPGKVLLIFDGLDEAKNLSTVEMERQYASSDTVEMPVGALFAKLASGKLLNGATVLSTTRSTAIPGVLERFYRTVDWEKRRLLEIYGFTPERVKEYVNKIAPRNMIKQLWDHISSNSNLLSLCYIPINCFITCKYFIDLLQNSDQPSNHSSSQLPTTLTAIYKGTLKGFILNHHSSYRDKKPERREFNPDSAFRPEVEKMLLKLGMLAKKGIEEGRLIISETEILQSAQFTDQEFRDLLDSSLLHHLPAGTSAVRYKYDEQYCFIHLTFQEFLAARFIINECSNEQLGAFATSAVTNSKMEMVLRFVAGLLRDEESSTRIDSFLQPLITSSLEPEVKSHQLMLVNCLFELQSEERAKELSCALKQKGTITLGNCSINNADCSSLAFVLQHTQEASLDLGNNKIGSSGCLELAKLVGSGNLMCLQLNENGIGDEGLKIITGALTKATCKVTTLHVRACLIHVVGAEHLRDALLSEHCQLTELNLGYNELTDKGIKSLATALQNCKLKVLQVERAGITRIGVEHLSTAIKSRRCQLKNLNLKYNHVTDEGAKCLADVLLGCGLEVLSIAAAGITAVGAKHISTALKHEQCQLTELSVSDNALFEKGTECLADALVDCKLSILHADCVTRDLNLSLFAKALKNERCQLRELYLGHNRMSFHLDGLANVLKTCKLTVLHIPQAGLCPVSARLISIALMSEHCQITELNLYGCSAIGDCGAQHLADALVGLHCKLKVLNVGSCGITSLGARYFSAALKSERCQLTNLHLGSNQLGDEGAEFLTDALVDCKLKVLNVSNCRITSVGAEYFSKAVKSERCQLTELHLRSNHLTAEDAGYFADPLVHCKLII